MLGTWGFLWTPPVPKLLGFLFCVIKPTKFPTQYDTITGSMQFWSSHLEVWKKFIRASVVSLWRDMEVLGLSLWEDGWGRECCKSRSGLEKGDVASSSWVIDKNEVKRGGFTKSVW